MKRRWYHNSDLHFVAGGILAGVVLVGGSLALALGLAVADARANCADVAELSGNQTEFRQYGPMGLTAYACFIQLDGEWWDIDNVRIDGKPIG